MKMEQSVPKCRHIKFRRRGITQKKTYNIRNTAKVWNQEFQGVFSLVYPHIWMQVIQRVTTGGNDSDEP